MKDESHYLIQATTQSDSVGDTVAQDTGYGKAQGGLGSGHRP